MCRKACLLFPPSFSEHGLSHVSAVLRSSCLKRRLPARFVPLAMLLPDSGQGKEEECSRISPTPLSGRVDPCPRHNVPLSIGKVTLSPPKALQPRWGADLQPVLEGARAKI